MILLAAWLATQAWSWSPSPTATSYRVYYGPAPSTWCEMQYVEVQASACDAVSCEFDLPEPTGDVIFFTVSALNSAGESTWDHGSKVPCP